MNINGVLTIRTIQGRNGPFNVGRLITDLGEFAVKDTLLEQYEEGRYEGNFNITQIFPSSYLAGGRFVVEVRATIKSLTLDGVDDLKPEDKEVASELAVNPGISEFAEQVFIKVALGIALLQR